MYMPQYLLYKGKKCGSTARGTDVWTRVSLILEAQERGLSVTKTMTITDICQLLISSQKKQRPEVLTQKKQKLEVLTQKKQAQERKLVEEIQRLRREQKQEVQTQEKQKAQFKQKQEKLKKLKQEFQREQKREAVEICPKMSRLEILLTKAVQESDVNTIQELLIVCANLYYHGGEQTYHDIIYTPNDLPKDEVYDTFRTQYLSKQDPSEEMPVDTKRDLVKIKHLYPMGSLRKYRAVNIGELKSLYAHNKDLLIQGKIDGVSLRCWFEDGKLTLALTRYDHDYGVVKTDKALLFVKSPIFRGKLVIRGEIGRAHV